jgi:hypothetical protein
VSASSSMPGSMNQWPVQVAFRYTDSTGQLTVLATGGNLHITTSALAASSRYWQRQITGAGSGRR